MNKAGLAIALLTAIVVGGIFAAQPKLDIDLAALFYDPATKSFWAWGWTWTEDLRNVATLLISLLVAPAFLAIVGKLVMPRRRMLIGGRAAIFLVATLALGPGVLANGILKDHWARMRPEDITQLGGKYAFTPWWDPRGPCTENCSFIAGEPSGAFWTLAPAALAPPQWRPLAYAGALLFGAAIGALRIAGGAHFFSDVVFAGVFMFLLIWTMYGLIYRWRPTRLSDAAVEQLVERVSNALSAFFRRLGGRRSL
ncbi:MAG TPA: phosphatase PAP2 family protein [Xanthobacteraceae bacterium]|nr:phosphatase PAP2 family protein [Xanthobacteraceae bacterium]